MAFEPDAADPPAAPMSAARLAAEAIFGNPPRPAATSPAQVIVRRARLVASAGTGPVAVDGLPETRPLDKSPRVFRVDPAPAVVGVPPVPSPPGGMADIVPPLPRRIATDKRPGPVLHVVHALPARPRPVESAASSLGALIARLARVGPVLDAIEQAQAFSAIDDRFAAEWQRLSRRAELIRQELQMPLRWIDQQTADPAR